MILLIALWVNGALTMSQRLWPDLGPLLAQYTTSTFFIGYLAWTLAILWLALNVQLRSGVFQWAFWAVWLFAAAAITTESMGLVYAGWFSDTISVVFAFITLYAFERVIRSDKLSADERVVVITMGGLVSLDIFYLSLRISELQAAQWIDQARPYLYVLACLALAGWSVHRLVQRSGAGPVRLSYQAAQGSWSLLTIALVVSVMITSTTLINSNNSTAINLIFTTIIVVLLSLVFLGAVSESARRRIRVLLNKHFFSHRFDYRNEWISVSEALGHHADQSSAEVTALSVLVNATESQSGVLWLKSGGEYSIATASVALPEPKSQYAVPEDHPMIHTMACQQWVYAVHSARDTAAGQFNDDLPDWLGSLAPFWLVMPIAVGDELIGFAGLICPGPPPQFDYESLDIARLTSRQVAGFLQLHRYERQQEAQARFAVYSQMSSFLMHDLNNVLHQQSLILRNAPKHKDNPEFVEDVLETIDNSVSRLRTLVGRLGASKTDHRTPVNLSRVLATAMDLYSNKTAPPQLMADETLPDVACDHDRLAMAIGHIIKNAQDASAGSTVTLTADSDGRYARIRIKDSGSGMTEDFINHQLFTPFESTKESGGMGIGVYLTKVYIEELGGMINVDSTLGKGTIFSLFLPIHTGATHD